jgi:hypothetical protein
MNGSIECTMVILAQTDPISRIVRTTSLDRAQMSRIKEQVNAQSTNLTLTIASTKHMISEARLAWTSTHRRGPAFTPSTE